MKFKKDIKKDSLMGKYKAELKQTMNTGTTSIRFVDFWTPAIFLLISARQVDLVFLFSNTISHPPSDAIKLKQGMEESEWIAMNGSAAFC
jgi:hypothetical protein